MLSIIGNWIYIGILASVMGFALMQGYTVLFAKLDKKEQSKEYGFMHVLLAGILGTTLYAQVFSLFYRVNMEANILLIVMLAAYALWQRKYIVSILRIWKEDFSGLGKGRTVVWAILILAVFAFALSGAGPAKLIDTDWYHAQTIRWIEEFGCVKGVANLFYALGFNNAQHYFDALFSMVWVLGQSMKGTGGFFGLIMFAHGLFRVAGWKKHSRHIADVLAVWEMAYSIIVTAFYTDPYVDTLPNIIVLFIVTEWIALLEERNEDTLWYGFYCLLAVFAVVCKTSVAPVVLLTVYAVYLLVRQKKAMQILWYVGIGFLMAVPFVVTNIITSGYPVYLLTAVNLFDAKWKIDPGVLQYCVDDMVAAARNVAASHDEVLHCGLKWVPDWFMAESISHQILYLAIVIIVLFDLVLVGIALCKKKDVDFAMLWPRICVYIGLVYWFFTIPQVKYCWSFLILATALAPVYYLEKKSAPPFVLKGIMMLSLLMLLMYAGFYGLRTLGYMRDYAPDYLVKQADYKNNILTPVEKDGQTFYIRFDGGDIVCGYHAFPYLDNVDDLEQLVVGECLKDGFYTQSIAE